MVSARTQPLQYLPPQVYCYTMAIMALKYLVLFGVAVFALDLGPNQKYFPIDAADPESLLVALSIDAFDSARGLQPRDLTDLSRLDLENTAQMAWGRAGANDSSMVIANMTLSAPSNQPLLLTEKFSTLTTATSCTANETISVTLGSEHAFAYALDAWVGQVNGSGAPQKPFILITNNAGCGDVDQRAVFKYVDIF